MTVIRRLLLQPRIFQAISSYLQRRDRRQERIAVAPTGYLQRVMDYNLSVGEPKITRTRRAERLYRLIEPDSDDKLLIVGPRDVHELLLAWCYGFKWSNITGLDLYSRNSKIVVGDAQDTKFPRDSFDVIVSSATFSYCEKPQTLVNEMARILKPKGLLVFTGAYTDNYSEWTGNYVPDWRPLLEEAGLTLFHYDSNEKRPGTTLTTYGAMK